MRDRKALQRDFDELRSEARSSDDRGLAVRPTQLRQLREALVAREVHEMSQAVHRKVDASATHHGRGTQGPENTASKHADSS